MRTLDVHGSSLISRHAGLLTVLALGSIAIGLLMGFGAADLYEDATNWVLLA